MNTPTDRKYTKSHEWVKSEADGVVTVGITDHAQHMLGDLVFIEVPAVGRHLKQGEECAVVESVKAAADIYAPLSGEVLAVNTELSDMPEKINTNAYGTWIFRLQPANPSEWDSLLDTVAYEAAANAEQR